MIRSRLFHRLFSTMLIVVGLFSAAVYLLVVPLVEQKAYEIELNASGAILENVFTMAAKIKGGLEEQRSETEKSYKQQLRNVVTLAIAYIDWVFGQRDRGEMSDAEARRLVFEGLRAMKYGNDDYIWVTDYYSNLLSHPDPYFQGRNAADFRDQSGNTIIPVIISTARAWGEGFHTYPWARPKGQSTALTDQKISYFKDLPRHRLVVGTGAYLADIDAEVAKRMSEAVEDLRQVLRAIRINATGYVYIFDARNNMIIHPNTNIEGTEFSALNNPMSGHSIADELKAAADSGKPVYYLWDKPEDPGNYAYQKISWVRHFAGFDWYIASSVYVEDLRKSAVELSNRIMMVALAILVIGIGLAWLAARRLVEPLRRLADTAALVSAGDLSAQTGIVRDDEIGILAAGFDGMIQRVRDNIATLDSRVRHRTAELEDSNRRLLQAVELQDRAQAALADTEARQRLILDAIPAAIAYLDRDQRIRFANRRWADLVQRDKGAVVGRFLAEVLGRHAHGHIAPYLAQTFAGVQSAFEYVFPAPRTMITKSTLIPEIGPEGAVQGMFVLSLDVTDEKDTEKRLMEAQRLNAVGQLSGGLAHDFNNLLSIIIGNLAAARDRYGAVEGLDEFLEPAQRAGRRGADITSRLLAFSRRQPLKPQPVDVGALIREMAVLLRRSLPSSIDMTLPPEDVPCWAIADQNQLENALVNLVLNARDAMPGGGRLDIGARIRTIAEPAMFDEMAPADDYLEIVVADGGLGFDADALPRAFEPFFTTKEQGSGLGLSMVYGFVKQSHGYIRIDSRAGAGAAITILLPRAEPVPQPEAIAAADSERRWPGRLALVAEDNEDVRQIMRRQLMELGFSVVEAESGDEAAILVEQIEDLHLVISDIVMPGLSGVDLAHKIKATRPEICVVLISGFSFEGSEDQSDLVVLAKPWEKQDLIDAIGRSGSTIRN
ncbi:cache domain-containing protein [Magnetospirillum sulfuroxidans]|uniref:histidine kinase n=1 Tax=Magnetospirillum sulfuroxidans TaxID=611300 RepID=A0ABS5IHJ0_9PROT|nr:cache domain-containing protein [Magnetospirillum sulfuroxidans]MBR9973662.1 cache domain-containing protein [Magnetospirillum sulfuroxidans]